MLKLIIRLSAPRTRPQFILSFIVWQALFQLVFLTTFAAFGLWDAAPPLTLVVMGIICVTPFLSITMSMLRYQILLQRRMKQVARTDLLTMLSNRRGFVERVEARLKTSGGVLLMIDIDHFKRINDSYGHAVGDLCLQVMADQIRAVAPSGAVSSRIGGEEFAIYFSDADAGLSANVGKVLAQGVELDAPGMATPIRVTNSVGGAQAAVGARLSDLMIRADHALYEAKEAGRARMVLAQDPIAAPMAETG